MSETHAHQAPKLSDVAKALKRLEDFTDRACRTKACIKNGKMQVFKVGIKRIIATYNIQSLSDKSFLFYNTASRSARSGGRRSIVSENDRLAVIFNVYAVKVCNIRPICAQSLNFCFFLL